MLNLDNVSIKLSNSVTMKVKDFDSPATSLYYILAQALASGEMSPRGKSYVFTKLRERAAQMNKFPGVNITEVWRESELLGTRPLYVNTKQDKVYADKYRKVDDTRVDSAARYIRNIRNYLPTTSENVS